MCVEPDDGPGPWAPSSGGINFNVTDIGHIVVFNLESPPSCQVPSCDNIAIMRSIHVVGYLTPQSGPTTLSATEVGLADAYLRDPYTTPNGWTIDKNDPTQGNPYYDILGLPAG